jgi:nucleoside-diphosphate-sugar epimerase
LPPSPESGLPLPARIENVEQLDDLLSTPAPGVIDVLGKLDGDLIVLGVAGKMGPTLARSARRASDDAGKRRRVVGVARFSDPAVIEWLQRHGVETVRADLLDPRQVAELPDAPLVVWMGGMKFGTTGREPLTWAMNTYAPALVGERFKGARVVAFSTGNVYGLTPVARGGSLETDATAPVGEYSLSALGRERIFQYSCRRHGSPTAILRLNYAVEMRYGVLVDVARKVWAGSQSMCRWATSTRSGRGMPMQWRSRRLPSPKTRPASSTLPGRSY